MCPLTPICRRRLSGKIDLRANPFDVRFGSKADMCSATWDVRFVPNSGHGVAPSEQMSFAVAAMASGRGPGEDRLRPRCVPQQKFCSLGVRMILFDLGETQSAAAGPAACRRSPCAPC